jgi:hypothetical protein
MNFLEFCLFGIIAVILAFAIDKNQTELRDQRKAIQNLCGIVDKLSNYENGYDIPMDCQTLERL